MPSQGDCEKYKELFKNKNEGNYLYHPPTHEDLHPGSIGFFDDSGTWNEITDLSDPVKMREGGYAEPKRSLKTPLHRDSFTWKKRTSESESERALRGKAGVAAAAAGAPVEASGELKYKTGSTEKAALITIGGVRYEKYKDPFGTPIQEWVKQNGNKLVDKEGFRAEIAKYGLWAIQATWVTDACAITMTSGSSHDIDLELDVGVIAIGKLGGGRASLSKLESVGWSTYSSEPGSKGRVISYSGVKYMARKMTKWFCDNPLRVVTAKSADEKGPPIRRPIFDEEGNLVGFDKVRWFLNSEGEKEFRKLDYEDLEVAEGEGCPIEVVDVECEGMSEEDIQAEKQYKEEEEQKMLKQWKEHAEETEAFNKLTREVKAKTIKK